jgi:MoxR-like ATPase
MADFSEFSKGIISNVERVIIGKRPQIVVVLSALLARGHVLLQDVPGLAKTMLARSLATTLGCDFKRVQCTPDLLPADITGVSVFDQKSQEFRFMPGPVFTNVLLADEINRATPRTQSALLEAMEEKQISADGITYKLPAPFMVIATQNPVEQEGTFPLPEAQLDRFLIRVSLGYPAFDQESDMLDRLAAAGGAHPIDTLQATLNAQAVTQMQQAVTQIFVHPMIRHYVLQLVHATRDTMKLSLGASPRASIALFRTAQAMAAIEGRNYVIPDDIKRLAAPVLAHRLIMKPEFRLRGESTQTVIDDILKRVEAPANTSLLRSEETASKQYS